MPPEDPPEDASPDTERVVTWLRSLEAQARADILEAIHDVWCPWCHREGCHGECMDDT